MKKLIAIGLLTICLSAMMVGCGDKNNSATDPSNSPDTTTDATDTPNATDTPEATDNAGNDDNLSLIHISEPTRLL